ncbi:MAG TPA: biopolymer transporter ExbD [Crinalium sp.]|jgi:biopolymer transport protein ExbD
MRFKTQQKNGQMPDVNLVPMMDVLMTILTFFIIISMTLSTQQRALNVTLPNPDAGGSAVTTPDPMLVVLNTQGQIAIQGKTVTDAELARQIETYLSQNPQGAVLLKADRKVEYEQLANLLSAMQNVGGDRVSLAIDSN